MVQSLGALLSAGDGRKHVPIRKAANVESTDDGTGERVGEEHGLDAADVVGGENLLRMADADLDN